MHIIIRHDSDVPIYEQIESEIRAQILSEALKEGELLPSIRTLARELKIGVITAKRAYDDLCGEGFCRAVQGKGVFVARVDKVKADEAALSEIRSRLDGITEYADKNSVKREKLKSIIKEYTEGI